MYNHGALVIRIVLLPRRAKIPVITHPTTYVIGKLVNPLTKGSLFVSYLYIRGSTHSQIRLNTDPLTKSAGDLS